MMDRRSFLQNSSAFAGLSAMGLAGCARRVTAPSVAGAPSLPFYDAVGPIIPIRAHVDRIFRITVCLRPFRPAGPRMDVERVGDKVVVHNYGHGGSGWSLSWGSADVVVRKALEAANGSREVAVIGCGALGLTAADHGAARGAAGDDLCEGAAALRAIRAGDGVVDPGLSDSVDLGGFA
jgi:D-amino-acid oxidase